MTNRAHDIEAIFLAALEHAFHPDRQAYVEGACKGDPELLRRVTELLNAHEESHGPLDVPPSDIGSRTAGYTPAETVGTQVGPYKLLQVIGEGGMGIVYMAEQLRPVHRYVAVKIIKQGMDTRQFIARFEAERQALALMDHPNIARVLDAGCTQTGRPYFVMELVKGTPITKFCDDNRLTSTDRLALFVAVCQAVQHAHQKGIIHRDLKPSNVLVALYDDRPVPKVIDFGVAKATSQKLTEKTLFTQIGQIVGTWEYMSPEQAVLNQLDVDTRTDVYSLGVILYELLTGVTPLDSRRLRSAALEETLRLIREEEPLKPSTRISSLGDAATTTAVYRGTNITSLAKTLRGDLDWIVMKALEKSRSRRYETATGLAADVNRYLSGEPIQARPPSTVYRLSKTAMRHRVALTSGVIVALTLVAATVASSWFALDAWRTLTAAQNILFDKVLMYALSGDVELTEMALKDASAVKLSKMRQEFAIAVAYTWNGNHDEARAHYAAARQYDADSFAIRASEIQVIRSDRDFYPRVLELRDLHPSEPLDYIFQVQSEAWYTPVKALEALDKCGDWKNSTLAQYFGAIAHANHALLNQDLEEAENSVDAFEPLLKWYPGNKLPLCGKLYNSLVTRNIALRKGEMEQARRYESIARQAAEALTLADGNNVFWATRSRAWFYAECGEGLRALDEWKKRMGHEPLGVDPMHYAACCCLFGDQSTQQNVMDSLPDAFDANNAHAHLAKAYLLALSKAAPEDVERACAGLLALNDPRREMQCGVVEVWLAYGDLERARQAAREILKKNLPESDQYWPEGNRHWDFFLQYVVAGGNDGDFICDFEGMNPPMFQAKAEYLAGLIALAQGRTEDAKKNFSHCRDSGRVFASWYWWSKVLLQRLDEDSP